jgi:hypothetical protein
LVRPALVALALLLRAAPLAAQLYTLAPPPYQTVLNNAGAPVSNACVWTYSAGTTTPAATFSDSAGTANTNPIRTDPAGRFTAYLTPSLGYKFVYELPCTPPAHGVTLRTADNIAGVPAAPAVGTGTWIPSVGGTATYTVREGTYVRIGALVFARGTLAINVLGTGSGAVITGLPFPAYGDTVGVLDKFVGVTAPISAFGYYLPNGGTQMTLLGLGGGGGVTAVGASFLGDGTAVAFAVTYTTLAP